MLRRLRQRHLPTYPTPRVLGIDDWVWRKGHDYGTLLVDLERHQPIELLADRTAATLADWLRQHPGIEMVTRDRSQVYAEGIRAGAPQAIQVADRWHLLKNLSEMTQRVVAAHTALVEKATAELLRLL